MVSAVQSSNGNTATAAGTAASAANAAGSEDRFLKLLVAQISNQDPMNPMDNAQMTSQMAQISTVSSIEKVNQSLSGLAAQLASLQTLQGGSLIGRDILVESNRLTAIDGKARGAVDLDLPADKVLLDVLSASGQVLKTVDLGAKGAGRHAFEMEVDDKAAAAGLSYRITATKGTAPVTNRIMVQDRVVSVGAEQGVMHVQLRGLGNVGYDAVKSIL